MDTTSDLPTPSIHGEPAAIDAMRRPLPVRHAQRAGLVRIKALGVGPFSLVFAYFIVFGLLSWPANMIWPDSLYEEFVSLAGFGERYDHIAFVASVASFLLLGLLYRIFRVAGYVRVFQQKVMRSESGCAVWLISLACGLTLCGVIYSRAGYTFPLLAAADLDSFDYRVFRTQVADSTGGVLVSALFYGAIPVNLVSAVLSPSRRRPLMMVISIALLGVGLMFSLARGTIAIPIITVSAALFASKRLRASFLVWVGVILCSAAFGMFAYSTLRDDARLSSTLDSFSRRVIHGQWVGLPLYIAVFEQEKTGLVSVMNPVLKRALGETDRETPGRRLMWFAYPEAARKGAAGNMPTLYIGEAYAMMGWAGVAVATAHVFLYILITAWSFAWIQKTLLSCAIYGVVVVKIASGVVNGYSAFLGASTSVMVLGVALWAVVLQVQRRGARGGDRLGSAAFQRQDPKIAQCVE